MDGKELVKLIKAFEESGISDFRFVQDGVEIKLKTKIKEKEWGETRNHILNI